MTFEERLENWALWATLGANSEPRGHCRSIEHRYKPEDVTPERVYRREPDERDAVKVEQEWRKLNPLQRKALRFQWVQRFGYLRKNHIMGEGEYLRRLSIALNIARCDVYNVINQSEQALKKGLDNCRKVAHNPHHIMTI